MDSLAEGLSGSRKDELIEALKQEYAIATFQELLLKMTDKCFKACVNKPGTSLDNSEQKCVVMCTDRYMDSYNIVTKAYTNRLQKESLEK